MPNRGPDPLELALMRSTRSKLRLLEVQETLRRALDEDRDSDAAVAEHGVTPPRIQLDRTMTVAVQVHRGVAFWNRDPVEPTPIRQRSTA